MELNECEVRENCLSFAQNPKDDKCWICNDYSLYYPLDKKILCKRQIRQREERKVHKKEQKNSEASKRGKSAKRKGYMGEHEIVKLLKQNNIKSDRVPLSGALKGEALSCDVTLQIRGTTKRAEVKRRKSGLSTLYKWLEQDKYSNYLFMRQDNKGWLVTMTFDEYLELIKGHGNEDRGGVGCQHQLK
jgi:hypothetical protein